ncbi:MAG: hypothetical protein HY695_34235 [Deltaproteobacteria bacterium]|nr:hypothetical protein [Deltaproteobacteria bacterium]
MKRVFIRQQAGLFAALAFLLIFPAMIWGDDGDEHRVDQLQLGTSGGNINDISKGFCYGGTLGALVQDANSVQYILSNNHVLARTNAAAIGEDIIQPGLIDQSPACFKDANDVVADLSAFVRIGFKSKRTIPLNSVDAAIAQVRAGALDPTGSILDIGVISSATLAPSLGREVKKSGRTSGLTHGTISSVNVTVDVSYGSGKTARFINQMFISPGSFIASGDSGSVAVEDVETSPRAVGLLFAGSSSVAVGSPINAVFNAFKPSITLSMLGNPAPAPSQSSLLDKAFAWVMRLWRVSDSHAATPDLPGQADPAAVDAVRRVKEKHEGRLMNIPGVVGVGVGLSEAQLEKPVIEVYVKSASDQVRRSVPASLEGVAVKIVETGEIRAY